MPDSHLFALPPDDHPIWDKLDAFVGGLTAEDIDGHDACVIRHGRLTRVEAGRTLVSFAEADLLHRLKFLELAGGGHGETFTVRVTERGRYQRQLWAKRVYRAAKGRASR
jgi:hypothetical protein